jgi:hypothetical protein
MNLFICISCTEGVQNSVYTQTNLLGSRQYGKLCCFNQYTIQQMHSVIHHLRHVSTPTCFSTMAPSHREPLQQRYISQQPTPGSVPTYRNDGNLKVLQYIQLITINYSSMILKLKYVMWKIYTFLPRNLKTTKTWQLLLLIVINRPKWHTWPFIRSGIASIKF